MLSTPEMGITIVLAPTAPLKGAGIDKRLSGYRRHRIGLLAAASLILRILRRLAVAPPLSPDAIDNREINVHYQPTVPGVRKIRRCQFARWQQADGTFLRCRVCVRNFIALVLNKPAHGAANPANHRNRFEDMGRSPIPHQIYFNQSE